MQKVSEMQDTEVNPPPGGRVASGTDQPGAGVMDTGAVTGGTVVAGGKVVVDVVAVTGVVSRAMGSCNPTGRLAATGELAEPQAAAASTRVPVVTNATIRLWRNLPPY
jgi:hypothetical protein